MISPPPIPRGQTDETRPICVLVSGGLDSCILAAEEAKRHPAVYPVFIRQGLRWESAETHWLRRFLEALEIDSIHELTVLDLPVEDLYGVHWSTTGGKVPGAETEDVAVYLPGRNVLLLTKAAVYCAMQDIPQIAIGVLDQNPFPDATPEFFGLMEAALSSAMDSPIRITRPFAALTKKAVTLLGRDLPLELSFSCIHPQGSCIAGRATSAPNGRRDFARRGWKTEQFMRLPVRESGLFESFQFPGRDPFRLSPRSVQSMQKKSWWGVVDLNH